MNHADNHQAMLFAIIAFSIVLVSITHFLPSILAFWRCHYRRWTILFLNIIAVQFFGEAEFWFASIKLITITGLIIVSIVIFFGGGPDEGRLGFRYWEHEHGWGAFTPYLAHGAAGRFLAFWIAFVKAG